MSEKEHTPGNCDACAEEFRNPEMVAKIEAVKAATEATDALPQPLEVVEILKWFRFGHLTGQAREVSRQYGLLAAATVLMCPPGEQRAFALQMLLVAKDAAVRSVLP